MPVQVRDTQVFLESNSFSVPAEIVGNSFSASLTFPILEISRGSNFPFHMKGFSLEIPELRGINILDCTPFSIASLRSTSAPVPPIDPILFQCVNDECRVTGVERFHTQELFAQYYNKYDDQKQFLYFENFDLTLDARNLDESFLGITARALVTIDLKRFQIR